MRVLILMLGLAACVPVDRTPVPEPVAGTCGAEALQGLVGQDAAVLQTLRFGQTVRIIRPGMAVTMDYSEDRLNISIDGTETIVSVRCG